jgi:DNA-binding response OmpR family regulator
LKRVLVIEDDHELVELLDIHLSDLECEVDKSYDGREGLDKALSNTYDLYVLDLMLPGLDGLEICRKIRAKEINTPILMLTAKAEEIDKVLGLEMGADDYLTKPFSVREFVARVKAMFRRMEMSHSPTQSTASPTLDFGRLKIDIDKHKVTIDNERIELSPKEFELLILLASNPGKSYNRSQLLNLIWGYDFEGYEHTVNSHINRLRRKIEHNIESPEYVLTTWGVGYRFNEDIANAL